MLCSIVEYDIHAMSFAIAIWRQIDVCVRLTPTPTHTHTHTHKHINTHTHIHPHSPSPVGESPMRFWVLSASRNYSMSIVLSEFAQTIMDINFGTGAKSPLPPFTMLDDAFFESPMSTRILTTLLRGGGGLLLWLMYCSNVFCPWLSEEKKFNVACPKWKTGPLVGKGALRES